MSNSISIHPFHHQDTGTLTYVVSDNATRKCLIIDAVLDFSCDEIKTTSFEKVMNFITQSFLDVEWILDTHVHADHLTAAFLAKDLLKCNTGISEGYRNLQKEKSTDSEKTQQYYTHHFKNGDSFNFGSSNFQVLSVPGHTATCVAYIIEDNIFCGDILMMPEVGCGRCDLDGGDAFTMYDSVQKIFSFPEDYKIYTCHDYPQANEKFRCMSTIADQKKKNVFFKETDRDTFALSRKQRDAKLSPPRLIRPALTYNLFKTL
jgi:glyoxylase-like metal-dependent hydrolase (beta-lactamase superfamily II)